MRPDSATLEVQLVIIILGPPIIASLWRFMSRGWARTVQGGTLSDKTKRRQKLEFWILLGTMYAMVFCMAIYAWFIKSN